MKKNYLVVRTRSAVTRLEREEIVYVLKDERRLIVVTQEKEYVYNATMEAVEEVADSSYYRPLDRCYVNLSHLKSVDTERRRLIFMNDDELFLGRDACAKMKKIFYSYLIHNGLDGGELGDEPEIAAEEESAYK
ncbi:MAG: LytTR family transcriptional regulator DNA-binding domain-containing protein [Firmicutes bacterium]|nr:LytTR family transcriptional regulator DNA-binding domain-containing protein [Bacillota bacterium]